MCDAWKFLFKSTVATGVTVFRRNSNGIVMGIQAFKVISMPRHWYFVVEINVNKMMLLIEIQSLFL